MLLSEHLIRNFNPAMMTNPEEGRGNLLQKRTTPSYFDIFGHPANTLVKDELV